MFRIANVAVRYYEFEHPETRKVLHIEPPKLKTLRNLQNISKSDTTSIDEMAEAIAKVIGKNKERVRVEPEKILEWMDSDQLAAFIKDYLSWLNKEKKRDPN